MAQAARDTKKEELPEDPDDIEGVRVSKFVLVSPSTPGESPMLKPWDTSPAVEAKSAGAEEAVRVMRKRVPASERSFIWSSTNGLCYLCKTRLPPLSSWHIEHVVAFSDDPAKNDVLGNMLPACAACNLRKNDKNLPGLISTDFTFDLMTAAKDVAHLNTAARNSILYALKIKHDRSKAVAAEASPALIEKVLNEVELLVHEQAKAESSTLEGSQDKEIQASRIDPTLLEYDVDATPINNGSFGLVYTGKLQIHKDGRSSCVDVAIKFPRFRRGEMFSSLFHELKMLQRVQHVNIVHFYGWFTSANSLAESTLGLVLEWCSHCLSMPVAVRNIDPVKIFSEVAAALEYMHSQQCVHRDVKPNNILVHKVRDVSWTLATAKLCDLGSAKFLFGNSHEVHTRNAGTAEFRPPEVRRGICTPKSDVFSLGKTLMEVRNDNAMLLGDQRLSGLFEACSNLLTAYSPDKRPAMSDVREMLSQFSNPAVTTITWSPQQRAPQHTPHEPSAPRPQRAEAATAEGASAASAARAAGGPAADGLDPTVFISTNGRRREFPSGKKGMKFHCSTRCGALGRAVGICEVPLSEASEFGHTACKKCEWSADDGAASAVEGIATLAIDDNPVGVSSQQTAEHQPASE